MQQYPHGMGTYRRYFLGHLACAALRAISFRCPGVSFSALALLSFKPPNRHKAAAVGFLPSETGLLKSLWCHGGAVKTRPFICVGFKARPRVRVPSTPQEILRAAFYAALNIVVHLQISR